MCYHARVICLCFYFVVVVVLSFESLTNIGRKYFKLISSLKAKLIINNKRVESTEVSC